MREEYRILADGLLYAYHNKVMNLKAATALHSQVREHSMADYAFRLSVGLEGLQTAASASSDDSSVYGLESLIVRCNKGDRPLPSAW